MQYLWQLMWSHKTKVPNCISQQSHRKHLGYNIDLAHQQAFAGQANFNMKCID